MKITTEKAVCFLDEAEVQEALKEYILRRTRREVAGIVRLTRPPGSVFDTDAQAHADLLPAPEAA